jgi:uncharacterized Zn-finger protein
MLQVHPRHVYVCAQCPTTFKNQASLKEHSLKHAGKHFACDHCDKEFHSRKNLRMHKRVHLPPEERSAS